MYIKYKLEKALLIYTYVLILVLVLDKVTSVIRVACTEEFPLLSYHLSPVLTMLGLLPYPLGCLLLLNQTSDVTLIHNDVKYHNIDDKINKHDKCQFKMYTDGQFSRSWSYILAVFSSCQHGYKANLLRHIDRLKKRRALTLCYQRINKSYQSRQTAFNPEWESPLYYYMGCYLSRNNWTTGQW